MTDFESDFARMNLLFGYRYERLCDCTIRLTLSDYKIHLLKMHPELDVEAWFLDAMGFDVHKVRGLP